MYVSRACSAAGLLTKAPENHEERKKMARIIGEDQVKPRKVSAFLIILFLAFIFSVHFA